MQVCLSDLAVASLPTRGKHFLLNRCLTVGKGMNYLKTYNQLVSSRSKLSRSIKQESHHITPKSMGGSDEKNNLVNLTPREHFIAHKLLAKIYGGRMWAALAYMSRGGTNSADGHRVTARDYALAKKKDSEWRSDYYTKNNPFKGKTFTHEQLNKLRVKRPSNTGDNHPRYGKKYPDIGAVISFVKKYKPSEVVVDYTVMNKINALIVDSPEEIIKMGVYYKMKGASLAAAAGRDYIGEKNPNYGNGQAISGNKNPMYGKEHSAETKRKIGEKSKRRIVCPHCEKSGNIANMRRWHFDNCKTNKQRA